MDLKITKRKLNGRSCELVCQGELDILTSPGLRDAILQAVKEGSPRIAINLKGVAYMDSTGLGAIIASLKRVKEHGGDLCLVSPTKAVMKVLDIISGILHVVPVFPNEKEAVQYLHKEVGHEV